MDLRVISSVGPFILLQPHITEPALLQGACDQGLKLLLSSYTGTFPTK